MHSVAIQSLSPAAGWTWSNGSAGAPWNAFPAIPAGSGLLLDASYRVRYTSDGTIQNATVTFVAFDGSSGAFGTVASTAFSATGAFSSHANTAIVQVSRSNAAPEIAPLPFYPVVPTGQPISAQGLIGSHFVDANVQGVSLLASSSDLLRIQTRTVWRCIA